jgi:anaerobic selenocysteine-containing dehydrogenase
MAEPRTAYRTCPLCEAGCGLEITLAPPGAAETVQRIRGDRDDVFSHGFICPKGSTLGHLHDDPDRLRRPVVKRDGVFVEVGWDEAFAEVEARLMPILAEHGRDACAIYLGNPGAHSLGPMIYNRVLITALGTKNRFSASTVDQRPKEMSAAMMFGSVAVPVPDLDRTDFLLMLGANPYASNGSLCTAPDFPGRLEAIQGRGGTVVVVDPRRSETAAKADRHLAIRPYTAAVGAAARSCASERTSDASTPHTGATASGVYGDISPASSSRPLVCSASRPGFVSPSATSTCAIAARRWASVPGRIAR